MKKHKSNIFSFFIIFFSLLSMIKLFSPLPFFLSSVLSVFTHFCLVSTSSQCWANVIQPTLGQCRPNGIYRYIYYIALEKKTYQFANIFLLSIIVFSLLFLIPFPLFLYSNFSIFCYPHHILPIFVLCPAFISILPAFLYTRNSYVYKEYCSIPKNILERKGIT